jgi:chromosome segregation ATPase
MTAVQQKLDLLKSKLTELIDSGDKIHRENSALGTDISRLKAENIELKTVINNLEERIKIIKLAKSLSETDEKSKQAKLRINELLREIDKCISILNK